MTSLSPSKRRLVEDNVCGQVLQLPGLLNFLTYHKIGIHGSDQCLVEALSNLPRSENMLGTDQPMWLIGSYKLTSEHLEADVNNRDYSWIPYLEIAIKAFNCSVEDYSYCFPLHFFCSTKEDRDALFLKTFREKAEYHSPERFQEDFWQASWRILLPVLKDDTLLDVVFITNQLKGGIWVCAIDTLYGSAHNLANAGSLLDILKKEFVPVEDPHQVVKESVRPTATKETDAVTCCLVVEVQKPPQHVQHRIGRAIASVPPHMAPQCCVLF
jgi:hypothetical protein